MIIKLNSTNPHLLDILHRNPSTDFGLYAKPLKNGVLIGNCVNANTYEITFQDSKYSYLPEDSNAIDFQSYASPLVVLHISNEFFTHLLKEKSNYDAASISWLNKTYGELDTMTCQIQIPTFYINSNWIRNENFLLSKYFPHVTVRHKVGHNYEVSIQATSIFEAVNLLNIVAIFVHVTNYYGVSTYIDDSFAEKYTRLLTNIENVPYFIFYLFIKKAIKSEKQFKAIQPQLESYLLRQGIVAHLKYGYNHQERINFITEKLNLENDILDFGCGEFLYYKKLMRLGFKKLYFGIDEDEEFLGLAKAMRNRYDENNLRFFTSEQEFMEKYNHQPLEIILSEVIEHNSEEEAKRVIDFLLNLNFSQLFVSTPNRDFNKYYFENEGDRRHHDHDFEMSAAEFFEFMQQFSSEKWSLTFDQIGDELNGVCPTQICIIQKSETHA